MSKYTIQHSPDGSMSIIFDRYFERFLPVTGAGYIFNATHDGNVTIGDLTCDARGTRTVQCIVYLYNSSLKRVLSSFLYFRNFEHQLRKFSNFRKATSEDFRWKFERFWHKF